MKAVTYHRYGRPNVLEMAEVPEPTVADDGVLIKVRAASVNRSDWETLTGRPAYVRLSGVGFRKPKLPMLGTDVSGTVEEVGSQVTEFRRGEAVIADTMYLGAPTFAEFVAVPEGGALVAKPPDMGFEEAAALPQSGLLAMEGMRRRGPVTPGDQVLINGAGGGGGSFAIQMARSMDAVVTAVDHPSKADLMRALGADHVIDYTKANYTKNRKRYDRILDFAGHRSILSKRRALAPGGVYWVVGGSMPRLLETAVVGSVLTWVGNRASGVLVAPPSKAALSELADMAAAGSITPAIDRLYQLGEVPEALERLGSGQALGKLVIRM